MSSSWLWFDVDDVLVDMAPHLQQSLDRITGKNIHHSTWTHLDFRAMYGIEGDWNEIRKIWKEDGVISKADLYPDVKPVLNHLHQEGYKIGLITARGWHPEGMEETQKMVLANNLPVEDIIVVEHHEIKAERLKATGTNVLGFIDDTPKHVTECLAAGFPAVLMGRTWNRSEKHLASINSLSDYPAWLLANSLKQQNNKDILYRGVR